MAFTFRCTPMRCVQWLALLAALAGSLACLTVLLTPPPSGAAPSAQQAPTAPVDSAALQWFSNRPAELDIKVSGVMSSAHGALAVLSLNGAPPRAFVLGERLAQGVQLAAIESDSVVITRGDERIRIKVNTLPDAAPIPRLTRP
ncbi:general secretion pathway protein GspC [Pseudomonas sp. S75]|uniref:type II secretion system protein N n=1 Tax=unclassified Pseudomonas TaxID=196821 RepID=UPI0019037E0F|nr:MULTISPECIES: type II secretion system protein N [unclassified Pseudomonas]MBJ9975510.1 general secretion pathway protein GspC [Pseudomonas sp. S30]MBK0153061.1 general secretion pathway protein GspC [Pseudomonas sp. S75]